MQSKNELMNLVYSSELILYYKYNRYLLVHIYNFKFWKKFEFIIKCYYVGVQWTFHYNFSPNTSSYQKVINIIKTEILKIIS